jgi:release factor glutamine methyltransferase
MATLDERLRAARLTFIDAGIEPPEATLDAELLARELLGWDRAALLTRRRDPVPDGFDREFDARVGRRAGREPVAYILGHQAFWDLDFEVTSDVLIPRPETEILVEAAIHEFGGRDRRGAIVDVGTGSGCIAVALALELPQAHITAIDVSRPALDVARRNAARHGAADRITFVNADLLEGAGRPVDLIVSNPPYVSRTDALPPEVGRHEPAVALYADDEGREVLRRLMAAAPAHLASGGALIVEFGFGQESAMRTMAAAEGWEIEIRPDLQSIPRVAVLRR